MVGALKAASAPMSAIAKEVISEDLEEESSETQQNASLFGTVTKSTPASAIGEDLQGKSSVSYQNVNLDASGISTRAASTSTSGQGVALETNEEGKVSWNHKDSKISLVIPDIKSRVSSKVSRKRVSVKQLTSVGKLR